MPAKTEGKKKDTRFKPGKSGNPKGRPQGSRSKATLLAEALLEGQAEELVQTLVDKALEGDVTALRVCIERLVPPRKDRPVTLKLPKVEGPEDLSKLTEAVLQAVSKGAITPGEGQDLAGLIEKHRRAVETVDLEKRLVRLEETIQTKGKSK